MRRPNMLIIWFEEAVHGQFQDAGSDVVCDAIVQSYNPVRQVCGTIVSKGRRDLSGSTELFLCLWVSLHDLVQVLMLDCEKTPRGVFDEIQFQPHLADDSVNQSCH